MVAPAAALVLAILQSEAFPSGEDRTEIAEILRIQRQYGDAVWPGFGKCAIPIVLYDGRFEFLIGHPAPSPEWTLVESEFLPGQDLRRRPAQSPQGFAVRVDSIWCGRFATYAHMAQRIKVGRDFHLAATLHEMFHAFQAQAAPDRFDAAMKAYASGSRYPESDQGFAGLWKQEGALLADALAAKEDDAARARTLKFLEFRGERRKAAHLDFSLVDYEIHLEWLEGLGKYAELKVIELALANRDRRPAFDLRPIEGRKLSDLVQLRAGLGAAKGDLRFYQSGLAQARLLDRFRPDWKSSSLGKLKLEEALRSSLSLEPLVVGQRPIEDADVRSTPPR